MNENTSKIVEYTLVILIGLIISYVIFAQQQSDKARFIELEKRLEAVEQKIDVIKTDNVIQDLKIKQIDAKVNPKTEELTVNPDKTLTETENKETETTNPVQPKINPVR